MASDPTVSPRPGPNARPPREQRQWARRPCSPQTTCHLLGDAPLDCWALGVGNLSAAGVNLILDRVVPAGKVLTVELHHTGRQLSCRRRLRVVYSLQEPSGRYSVGGTFFQHLTDQEMQGLL
jgi:hypothetical protein